MEQRLARVGYWGGLLAITFLSAFGVVLLALHILAARHGGVPAYLSHFRLLPFAWLWLVGLALFAVGALALAIALHVALLPGAWTRATLTFLYALSPLAVLVAVFPATPPGGITDLAGRIHEGAAIAMFLSMGCAMLCLFGAVRDLAPFVAWSSLLVSIVFFSVTPWMLRGFMHGTPDVAYSERTVVLLNGVWLMMLGVWSRAETAPFAKQQRTRRPQPRHTAVQATD